MHSVNYLSHHHLLHYHICSLLSRFFLIKISDYYYYHKIKFNLIFILLTLPITLLLILLQTNLSMFNHKYYHFKLLQIHFLISIIIDESISEDYFPKLTYYHSHISILFRFLKQLISICFSYLIIETPYHFQSFDHKYFLLTNHYQKEEQIH